MIKRIKSKSLNDETKDALLEHIKSMNLSTDNKLPREEILAREFGVSRATLRSALLELSKEGILYRKHGTGTFVNPEVLKMKVTFNPALEFDKMIINSGFSAEIKLTGLEIRPAGTEIAKKLNIDKDDDLVIVKKIAFADGEPAIFWIDRLAKKIINGEVLQSEIKHSIFDYLQARAQKKIARDLVEISTVLNRDVKEFSEYIKPNKIKPFLMCESINFDQYNNPILFGTVYYDTAYLKFHMSRQMENVYNDE